MKFRYLFREIVHHYKKWWIVYLLVSVPIVLFAQNFKFVINVTDSLPGHFYLIHKGELPAKKDQLLAFEWADDAKKTQFPSGVTFLKIAAGLPGDTVRLEGGNIEVGRWSVFPKEFSKRGTKLEPNSFSGEIPEGHFFVVGIHRDSLDSRYAMVGLIPNSRVIGRAYELF